MIPANARAALEGVVPAVVATVSSDGIPNLSYVSQVWYVDEAHVAVSHQFFNKTMRNLREVPFVTAQTWDPRDMTLWELKLRHVETQTEGPTFEQMEMQLEVAASMTGTQGLWQLKAAEIFEVLSVVHLDLRQVR